MNDFSSAALKPVATVAGIAIAAGLAWLLFGDAIKRALAATADAVNPASDQNLAYRGVNAVGAAISGRDSFSLGSWVYDLFHEDANLASNPKPRTDEEMAFWANQRGRAAGG